MSDKEKIYILKHTPDGFEISLGDTSDDVVLEEQKISPPGLDILKTPRWDHWYQRKLARPWQATLLGMNIEPHPSVRSILKRHAPDRYQIYKDRMDILTTLMGYEIGFIEDHLKSGENANENYIELTDYCIYAEKLKWIDMHEMRNGLKLNSSPPVLEIRSRQENNILKFLDIIFENSIGNYKNLNGVRNVDAIYNWLADKQADMPVTKATLIGWIRKINDLDT